MSIIVDNDTKLVVSGLTGREGSFHGLRNRAYGTDLVAGVTPGKGGQDVEGVPVFDSIKESVEQVGANTSMIFVPARFAAPAIDEAIESGVHTVIAITEGIPVLDMLGTYWKAKQTGVRLIGPNCPGVLSPSKANVGIIPAQFFDPGKIGVVSKSGTLTYQIGNELKQAGEGNSSIVGIGGDPIIGSDFIDILTLYEADPDTELIVMVGEIGGDAEERAAEFIIWATLARSSPAPRAPPRPRRTRSKPRASASAKAPPRRRGLRLKCFAVPRLRRADPGRGSA
jgi:succinyl-CoA synthetase alpha subunit